LGLADSGHHEQGAIAARVIHEVERIVNGLRVQLSRSLENPLLSHEEIVRGIKYRKSIIYLFFFFMSYSSLGVLDLMLNA
jgi:hypothetical protein